MKTRRTVAGAQRRTTARGDLCRSVVEWPEPVRPRPVEEMNVPASQTPARPVLRSISCATGFLLRIGEWDNQGVECLAGVVGRDDAEGSVGAVVEDLHPRH